MIKITFFFLLTTSLAFPLGAYAETNYHPILDEMEEKTRKIMKMQSKMPENEKNSFNYWCMGDMLNTIMDAKHTAKYPLKVIDNDKLEELADTIIKTYSSDENFVFYSNYTDSVFFDYGFPVYNKHIQFVIDGESPLKMSIAQEILDMNYNISFMRSFMLIYEIESCDNALEETLGIDVNISDKKPINHS